MPVEIRELVIRAVAQSDSKRSATTAPSKLSPDVQQEVVEAAVKEVLRILRAGKER